MASKRNVRRKACEGKHKHATEAEAHSHLRSLHLAGKLVGRAMHAFKCEFCGSYHVGHIQAKADRTNFRRLHSGGQI
jgi:hypothetical protein